MFSPDDIDVDPDDYPLRGRNRAAVRTGCAAAEARPRARTALDAAG